MSKSPGGVDGREWPLTRKRRRRRRKRPPREGKIDFFGATESQEYNGNNGGLSDF